MEIGAQLFTLREYIQTEKDIGRTLQKVADMGYRIIQVSAMGKIEPKKLKNICDNLGLRIVLTHTSPDRILNETEKVIEEHDILGCDYIGIGAMPDKYRHPEWLPYFAEDYKKPAQAIAKAGKLFMYHNHNFEFRKINGKTIIEQLAEDFTPEEMGFTLDTYWVQAGGADVSYWFKKLSGRIPCVHLKDMAIPLKESSITPQPVMAPVMEGNINFPEIIKICQQGGTKYMLVEQDICDGSPFDCLELSLKNLKKLGY